MRQRRFGQIGVDRQRQDALRQILRDRQLGAVVVIAIGGLEMQRTRVVDRGRDATRAQLRLDPQYRRMLDREQEPNREVRS